MIPGSLAVPSIVCVLPKWIEKRLRAHTHTHISINNRVNFIDDRCTQQNRHKWPWILFLPWTGIGFVSFANAHLACWIWSKKHNGHYSYNNDEHSILICMHHDMQFGRKHNPKKYPNGKLFWLPLKRTWWCLAVGENCAVESIDCWECDWPRNSLEQFMCRHRFIADVVCGYKYAERNHSIRKIFHLFSIICRLRFDQPTTSHTNTFERKKKKLNAFYAAYIHFSFLFW